MKTNIKLYILSKSKCTTVLLFGIVLLFANISNLFAANGFDGCQDPIIRRVFYEVDQKPTYPGGEKAMLKFINDNLCHPIAAHDERIEGATVYIRFVVEKDGSLTEFQVLRGFSPAFDKAALEVVKQMPKWKPAKKDGKAVAAYFSWGVKFDTKLTKVCDQDPIRKVFYEVDQRPAYLGGEKAMQKFINDNLCYPAEALNDRIEGIVYVRFVVEKGGSITEPQVLRGISPVFDRAALDMIRRMPAWMPAKKDGKAVAAYSVVNVKFDLQLAKICDDQNPSKNVLYKADQMPVYPGGEKAMQEFIKENLNYPQEAQDERIEGAVYVRFVVEKDGSITGANAIRGIAPICDKAAVKVIRKMPRWKPGKDKGKPVAVYQTVRVEFELELAKTSGTIERLIPKGYLYVVGNREMSEEEVMKIKKEDFESMEKLREDHVKYLFKKYGYSLEEKKGIILINLKKNK